MFKKVFFIVLFILAIVNPAFAVDEEISKCGPGYKDLEGKVWKYEYVDFGGFKITAADNKIRWEGFVGLFKGVTAKVDAQVSRVGDGIYLCSWQAGPPGHGDNVVYNFNDMTVRAHLGGGNDFLMIHGTIYCFGNIGECEAPGNEVTPMPQIMKKLQENAKSMKEQGKKVPPLGPIDPNSSISKTINKTEGYKALLNKALHYRFENGKEVKLAISNEKIRVRYSDHNGIIEKKPHIFQISKGVFFISWGGPQPMAPEHIIFNEKEMKVYDQIDPKGKRVAMEAKVTCFGDIKNCPLP